jgi:hypothetical protein
LLAAIKLSAGVVQLTHIRRVSAEEDVGHVCGLDIGEGASAAMDAPSTCSAAKAVAFMVAVAAKDKAIKAMRDILKNEGAKQRKGGSHRIYFE